MLPIEIWKCVNIAVFSGNIVESSSEASEETIYEELRKHLYVESVDFLKNDTIQLINDFVAEKVIVHYKKQRANNHFSTSLILTALTILIFFYQ